MPRWETPIEANTQSSDSPINGRIETPTEWIGSEKGPGALEAAATPHTTPVAAEQARGRTTPSASSDTESFKTPEAQNAGFFEKNLKGQEDASIAPQQIRWSSGCQISSRPPSQTFASRTPSIGNGPGGGPPRESSLDPSDPAPADFDYPEGGFRANLVVFGAFSGMFAAFGFMNTLGTLQAYMAIHQLAGYNESAVGWIFSLYIFLAFFGGIQVGPAFDRWGPRGLVAAGGLLLVIGEVGLANATTFVHFIICLSILCGLGTTLIFTPCICAIAHWFCARRATMTGFAATGGSIGGVLFPLLLPSLFESIGWAWAMRLMALINAVAVLLSLALLRARLPPKRGTSVRPDFTIFKNLAFAFTTGGVFAMEWGLFVPLTFFSSWALGAGLGTAPAHGANFPFQLLAILNGASFFGRWLPGLAADRWGRFNTLAASMAGSLIFLVAVWLPAILLPGGGGGISAASAAPGVAPYDNVRTALAVVFALGFGFFFGAGISLTPVCVGELCDPREYGRWYSTCYSIVSFGCLTGVPIAGVILGDGQTQGWASLVAWTSACYAFSLACFIAARVARGGWGLLVVV